MASSVMNAPKFCKGQGVGFIGGIGTIKSYKLEMGTWTYCIEMAMGLEPDFGRLGHETMIVLVESELELLEGNWVNYLAIA